MTDIDAFKRGIKVCMFDQYGTVVDVQHVLLQAAAPLLKQKGWEGNVDAVVTSWRRTHLENAMIDALLRREHTSFRELGERAMAFALESAGISYTMDELRALIACMEKAPPFAEVPEALARLKKQYKIMVLSNGDSDMLENARQYHGIPFDRVISVAAANSFKPDAAAYTRAAELVGVRMDEILMVASHAFDCIGAKSAGMRTAFINRRQQAFGITPYPPDIHVRTMKDLADLLV